MQYRHDHTEEPIQTSSMQNEKENSIDALPCSRSTRIKNEH